MMKYKIGDWVIFKEPLMGMESNEGFILKEVFGKDEIRRIISIDEKFYVIDNYGGNTVRVKHKDLEVVTKIFNIAPSITKRINEKHNILNGLTITDAIKPNYYQYRDGDVFDMAAHFQLNFPLGNALKYLLRAGHKDPAKKVEDLQKAIQCIERAIELEGK